LGVIYVFLAEGFEEIEALTTVDLLRRAEYDVLTVGIGGSEVQGAHGICVHADLTADRVTTDGLELVVLPGGMPGTLNLEKSPIVTACVRYCAENGLPVAAICAAPSILGHMGLLKGKRAVCFPGFEGELDGANCAGEAVCVDPPFITAKGAGVAVEFALRIISYLSGEALAQKIGKSIQCM
jgi:4-methyl-5(b-hydroxyethyl)-thiazole monophosphate biosynthesis